MASPYGKLLLAVYELEGLLLVIEKHGEETPAEVFDLIKQKAAYIAEATQKVPIPEEEAEDEMLAAALDEGEEAPEEETPANQEEAEEEETVAEEAVTEEVTFDEADAPEADVPQYKRCPKCGQLLAETDAFCTECGAKQGMAAPAVPEGVATDAMVEEMEEDDYEECESYDEFEEEEGDEGQMSLEERLHRNMAKNMRQAFSLNDSIRFRRELFGNSQAEYNDALDMVQSMKGYDEAEEYFYGDLGWDRDSEVVEEFMAVVKKHFLA